jgi:excisionase family DNA binding protein
MTQRDPNIMTVKEAAAIVGKDPDTIYAWIRKGGVAKYTDPGGKVYVDVRECYPRPVPTVKTGTLPNLTE